MEIETVPFKKIKPTAKALIPKDAQHGRAGCVVRRLNGNVFPANVVALAEFAEKKNDSADTEIAKSMYHNAVYRGETFQVDEEMQVIPVRDIPSSIDFYQKA